MILGYIILATLVISLISLVGIFFIGMKTERFENVIEQLVSFAVGGLLGGAFLHLLPQAMKSGNPSIFSHVLFGIVFFFFIEKLLHWRYCHIGQCETNTFTYLNLIGDSVHNFIDGTIIAASFAADLRLGLVTTVAVAAHEIPHEMGDFGILVYGGFSKARALMYNLLADMAAIAGAVLAYFSFNQVIWLKDFLIPFSAGGFIYIALVDMMPELHKKARGRKIAAQSSLIFIGIGLMWCLGVIFKH